MSKQNVSATVDENVADFLSQDHVNASGLINKLVKQYMNGGGSEEQIREFRKKQIKSEYEDAAAKARRKIEEYNDLCEREDNDDIDASEREDQLERITQVPKDVDHPLVQRVAERLEMTPEEAITEAYK